MRAIGPRLALLFASLFTLAACSADDTTSEAVLSALDASAPTQLPGVVPADTSLEKLGRARVGAAYVVAAQAEGKTDPRYHLALSGHALVGHNFAQGFDATIDARGFEVAQPRDGWRARLQTRAIRCADERDRIGAGRLNTVEGEPHRASLERTSERGGFEEWVVNGPLGLEQGFVFANDPCGGRADELVVEVGLEGLTLTGGARQCACATVRGWSVRGCRGCMRRTRLERQSRGAWRRGMRRLRSRQRVRGPGGGKLRDQRLLQRARLVRHLPAGNSVRRDDLCR